MTREELEAVRNHISNLPTVGAMYAPVLVEWVSVLLRQRDEVTAQRDNAVDASKEGAWMARALDAERERDEAQSATVNAALIHADLVRERAVAEQSAAKALRIYPVHASHLTDVVTLLEDERDKLRAERRQLRTRLVECLPFVGVCPLEPNRIQLMQLVRDLAEDTLEEVKP